MPPPTRAVRPPAERVRPRESVLVLFVEKDTLLLRDDELLLPLLGVELTTIPGPTPASIRLQ